jgi:hypothetical protein
VIGAVFFDVGVTIIDESLSRVRDLGSELAKIKLSTEAEQKRRPLPTLHS